MRATAPAFLRIGGATLAQHQLGLALACGCQRIVCVAHEMTPDLTSIKSIAEDVGLQCHIVIDSRKLSGLVAAQDELLVFSEGLFIEPETVIPLLEAPGPVVLVQPVEEALREGFERIDHSRATAGIMKIPGHLVERLQELPSDYNIPSALTRIALQAGVATRLIPEGSRDNSNWRLVREEAEAIALESQWLRNRVGASLKRAPAQFIARFGVVNFGSSLLHAGNASNATNISTLVLLAVAGFLAWFDVEYLAFLMLAAAAVALEAGRLLRAAERRALGQLPPAIPRSDVLGWLLDIAFVTVMIAAITRLFGESVLSWAFPPVLLMLLLVLTDLTTRENPINLVGDRLLLGLILSVAAVVDETEMVVELLSLGLVAAGIAISVRKRPITAL